MLTDCVDEIYAFNMSKADIGLPPYQSQEWERVHQMGVDFDWRWNQPWDQERYKKECIVKTNDGVQVWSLKDPSTEDNWGCLYSNFSLKYGKVTAMIKLPAEKGIWSAFWLFGENGMPEYDVFEHCGGKKYVNVTHHWGYKYEKNFKHSSLHNKRGRFPSRLWWNKFNPMEWNKYSVEFTPYEVKYFINDICVRTMKKGISSSQMHIMLTAGRGDYCPCDEAEAEDGYMLVKWILIEKYK